MRLMASLRPGMSGWCRRHSSMAANQTSSARICTTVKRLPDRSGPDGLSHSRPLKTSSTASIACSAEMANHSPCWRAVAKRRWHARSIKKQSALGTSKCLTTLIGSGLHACNSRSRECTLSAKPIFIAAPSTSDPITYNDLISFGNSPIVREAESFSLKARSDREEGTVIDLFPGLVTSHRVAPDAGLLGKPLPAPIEPAPSSTALLWRHVHMVLFAQNGLIRQPLWVKTALMDHNRPKGAAAT